MIEQLAATPSDRRLELEREFDAPRELVWMAFADPYHLSQWWGPKGFTNPVCEMDVRAGGIWRFMMHGPDGVDYPNKIVYTEVVAARQLAYVHSDDVDDDADQFDVTVLFDDEGDKTRLTLRMLFKSAAERDRMVKEVGAIEGGNQTLDRLAQFLKQFLPPP